jgi:putative intracellular protease/amidase
MKQSTTWITIALLAVAIAVPTALAEDATPGEKKQMTLGVLLYPNFELLDVFGPVEMFGNVGKELKIVMVAEEAGEVKSYQGPKAVADVGFDDCPHLDILLVPGGFGTLPLLNNEKTLTWIKEQSAKADITTSVCSGSALLAKAGVLDNKKATSNKVYFNLATSQSSKVEWVEAARWVEDGNVVTSSGVSAGIDMALAVIARLWGEDRAEQIAIATEYEWHRDSTVDPFVKYLNQAPTLPN